MADQLTATGLETDDLETRTNAIIADLRARINPSLELSTATADGQFVRILAERMQSLADLVQAVHSNQYVNSAIGFNLAQLTAMTGTIKRAATYSTISSCQVQLEGSTTLPQGSIAHVVNAADDRFLLTSDIVNTSTGTLWLSCTFSAESAGPVQALASTLNTIAEPVTGWLAVSNNVDATLGQASETDNVLKARQVTELQTGSTSAGAVATALLQLSGMQWVRVIENDTGSVDANGNPPHSIHAITYSAGAVSETLIASTIMSTKAGGIEAYGSAIVTMSDSQNVTHDIGYSVAPTTNIHLEIDLTKDSDDYSGDTVVASVVAGFGDDNLGVGEDIILSKIIGEIFRSTTGVTDVTEIRVGDAASPTQTTNWTIAWNEIGDLDTSRITVNST